MKPYFYCAIHSPAMGQVGYTSGIITMDGDLTKDGTLTEIRRRVGETFDPPVPPNEVILTALNPL